VVTLSASFGAGGSLIGPRIAERLDVQFVDRAIPAAVSDRLAVPVEDAIAQEESPQHTLSLLLATFALTGAPLPPEAVTQDPETFRLTTEEVVREYAARGAVILGRAAAVVLRDLPQALHVRLDGPRQSRIPLAMRSRGVDEATATRQLDAADRSREAYVKHWYRVDPKDSRLYHLVIDSSAVSFATCEDLIVLAAQARIPSAGQG
jgi:cytidylate kinase